MTSSQQKNGVHNKFKMPNKVHKSVFILPSLITVINIYAGFYSVIESLKGYKYLASGNIELAENHFNVAAMCIGWAVLCDFLDGRVARLIKATSDFGVELDSLADILSFGIAPAVLAYTWGYGGVLAGFDKISWGVSFIYLICGALRLARFNVQAHKPIPTDITGKVAKKFFVGLPIPAAAGLIAAIVHFAPTPIPHKTTEIVLFTKYILISNKSYAILLLSLVTLLSFLMVSTIGFNSFKTSSPQNRNSRLILVFLALVTWLIYSYSEWTLLILSTTYVAQGILVKLVNTCRKQAVSESSFFELNPKQEPR